MANTESAQETTKKGGAVGLIATLVGVLIFIVGVGVFFWSQTYNSPSGTIVARSLGTAEVGGKSVPHVALDFQTYPNSTGFRNAQGTGTGDVAIHPSGNPDWPAYGMSNEFQVPAHSLVTVTVRQYDSGGALNNPWFAKVRGTVDPATGQQDVVSVRSPDGTTKTVSSWDPNNIGHTFTMRGVPGTDPGFFLNVPLPTNADLPNNDGSASNQDNGQYYEVTFSFVSGSKGTYAWNCEFPCGQMVASFGGVMSAYGFMSGFMHVV